MWNEAGPVLVPLKMDADFSLDKSSRQALAEATAFARKNQSDIVLFHVVNMSDEETQRLEAANSRPVREHYSSVKATLEEATTNLRKESISADWKIRFGNPWLAIVKEAIAIGARLVCIGTGEPGTLWRALLGSTSMKVLRKCPSPVWIAKTEIADPEGVVLVAHDLKEVGKRALQWGLQLAQEQKRRLVVLHAVEVSPFSPVLSSPALDKVESAARAQIEGELSGCEIGHGLETRVAKGSPAALIHDLLESMPVNILVMGTVARTGISGLIMGNTAETVLPWVSCSLVALKPKDFVSPVQPD